MSIVGIDLGTKNSVVATCGKTGHPECVTDQDGSTITASAVCFQNKNKPIVGNIARESKILYPDTTATAFKRKMGLDKVGITVEGTTFSPQELSAFVLKKLKKDAEVETGETIKKVIITVPAYFDTRRRQATLEAGKIAGFDEVNLLDEPVAAVLSEDTYDDYRDNTILVYDLGGGTLDVCCVRITKDEIQEIVIDGDCELGGDDWLNHLAEYVKEKYLSKDIAGLGDMDRAIFTQELYNKVEGVKIALSQREQKMFSIITNNGRKEIVVTRDEFEKVTQDLTDRAMKVLERAMKRCSEKGVTKIDKVLLCGGATRMTKIKDEIRRRFPDTDIYEKDQDLIVAKGAAVYARDIYRENGDSGRWKITNGGETGSKGSKTTDLKKLRCVTSKSYGVKAYVGEPEKLMVCNLVLQNEPLPVSKTETFYTRTKNQPGCNIEIFESMDSNETEEMRNCVVIGNCVLDISRIKLPADSPIEISITIGEDGILTVKGTEKKNGAEITATMQTKALMNEKEIAQHRTRVGELFANMDEIA